jgi:DNA modification methylase
MHEDLTRADAMGAGSDSPTAPAHQPMRPYYEQDGITIYHGEAAHVLPHLSPVDLLLTDPPYGIGEARGKNKSRGKLAVSRDYGNSDWDDKPPSSWLIGQVRAVARWQILFGGNYFTLPPAKCWLVWDKDNGDNDFADCELAWTNLNKAVRKLTYRWAGMLQEPGCPKENRVHPTQKPEAVMRWALLQAPQNVRTVLDPFMGSGTTLVACKRLGRAAIGIERDERYCELAAERLAQGSLLMEGVA